jgi:dipeptidase
LLAKEAIDEDWRLPTFFTPSHKLTPQHFMRVLRDHYEDTVYDVTDGYRKGTPNATTERTICTSSTINSTVFQLRGHLPVEIGALMWISMRRPDGSVYVPWYCGIDDVPPMFSLGRAEEALATHFTEGATERPQPPSFATFADLCRRLEANYREVFPLVRRMRTTLEASFFELQPTVEATAAELHAKEPDLARDFLTSYTIGQTGKTIRAIDRLCEQLSAAPAR